ncbi:MAG: pyrroloquinoline quinone biosynthesis protein PqqE [Geminicoccaceae bacterium]|nr:pyrroloquinoline quinone biosynthesis protein PqqE [Geminicoccaceae bacterium]
MNAVAREPWREPPIGLLAELTHRCPLACPYCSNPLELAARERELSTASWLRVLDQAAELGVLQLHLSGGEPTLRTDLEAIVARARALELYSNLITAGVGVSERRLEALAEAGLDHVQLSVQDVDPEGCDRIGGFKGSLARKIAFARAVRRLGLPLTLNAVVHRHNLDRLERFVELALELGADRLEVAHVQYYGWALANRAALMPTRAQLERSVEIVKEARERLGDQLLIDFVVPDYYATHPKPCTSGWGRAVIVVAPDGRVLPCHAAHVIPGLVFANVEEKPLRWIWQESPAFQRFRGLEWMQEPCRSCPRREIDFGGCRCQAMQLLGDPEATDPACTLSPHHARIMATAEAEASAPPPPFRYRRMEPVPA